jgi:hypothetical protein
MKEETLKELGEHLKQSITLIPGPRIGMILPQTFKSEGCDHTFEKTTEWLNANGHDVEPSLKWLKRRGADCDCQVITNIVNLLDVEL